jgi:hypothetical protein
MMQNKCLQSNNKRNKKLDDPNKNTHDTTFDKIVSDFNIVDKNDIFDAPILFHSEVRKRGRIIPLFEKRIMYLLDNNTIVLQKMDG